MSSNVQAQPFGRNYSWGLAGNVELFAPFYQNPLGYAPPTWPNTTAQYKGRTTNYPPEITSLPPPDAGGISGPITRRPKVLKTDLTTLFDTPSNFVLPPDAPPGTPLPGRVDDGLNRPPIPERLWSHYNIPNLNQGNPLSTVAQAIKQQNLFGPGHDIYYDRATRYDGGSTYSGGNRPMTFGRAFYAPDVCWFPWVDSTRTNSRKQNALALHWNVPPFGLPHPPPVTQTIQPNHVPWGGSVAGRDEVEANPNQEVGSGIRSYNLPNQHPPSGGGPRLPGSGGDKPPPKKDGRGDSGGGSSGGKNDDVPPGNDGRG